MRRGRGFHGRAHEKIIGQSSRIDNRVKKNPDLAIRNV